MPSRRPICPKCNGQLYLEQNVGTHHRLPPEWACLQCGWRRSFTPPQFEHAVGLSVEA